MFLALDLSVLNALNYLIYLILIVTILFGFLRGGKKSIYILIMMIVFFAIFFITIDSVANFLFTYEMPWLAEPLSGIDPSLSNFTTIEGSMNTFLELGLGENLDLGGTSAEVLDLASQIVKFILKIVWTIAYFTVIFIAYRIIVWIVGLFFVRNKKGQSKHRGIGAIVGGVNGLVAVYILIVMVGGLHSITTSAAVLLDDSSPTPVAEITELNNDIFFDSTQTVIPLAEGETEPLVSDEFIQYLEDFNTSYSNNLFVKLASGIKVNSYIDEETKVEAHINLFDRVFSFDYNESAIALRYELNVFATAGAVFLESEYATTQELTDITGDEIRDMFSALSKSQLITSLVPVAIEVAAEMNDITLNISQEDLYAIDYDAELGSIGSIAGALFDILNGAGFIGGEGDLSQVTITGDTVRDVFTDVSESDVILLLTDSILIPMLEDPEGNFSNIITVPADIDMEAEYLALGSIAGEIIDSGVSFADLGQGDPTILLTSISNIDLTILKNSDLVSSALINIFSGNSGIEGLDIIETPTGIVWEDDGLVPGELTKILTSLNVITSVVDDIDFADFDLAAVSDLTPAEIDTFFDSYVIRATISEFIKGMDLTGMPLVFPDSIYDAQNYFTESELTAVVEAVTLIVDDTTGNFEVVRALNLTEAEIQTLLASDIIYATIGDMIYDYGTDMLTIPGTVVEQIQVNGLNQPVISKAEVTDIFEALAILSIDDFDNMAFDAGIIENLENTAQDDLEQVKLDTLLDSQIIHATVSKMIVDLGTGTSDLIVIPDLDVTGNDLHTVVGGLDYISKTEISHILKALYAIDVTNFDTMDLEDTSLIMDNLDDLLVSSIIQATISKQMTDLGGSVLVIPEQDVLGGDILIHQGTTTYIDADELEAVFAVIDLMGVADPTQVNATVSLATFSTGTNQDILLTSAIMHATVSDTLMSYGSGILIIPVVEEDDTPVQIEVGPLGNETTFIAKQEVKDMLTALTAMGFLDINSFTGAIDASVFLSNSAVVLESASLQATISDIILNSDTVDTATPTLIIPDEEIPGAIDIRIAKTDVTYISKAELTRFFTSVNELGITNFDTFGFDASDIFGVSATFFDSFIMQATASKYILDNADDQTAAVGTNALLVPTTRRENISVDTVVYEQIQKAELLNIFDVLSFLGMNNFTSSVPAATIQGLTRTQIIDDVLVSASFHVTIDNMLRANPSPGFSIPNIALANYYGLGIDLTTPQEIADLVVAINIITSGGNFTSTSFDYTDIANLSQAQRDEVIYSLTIRQLITPQLEALADVDPLFSYDPLTDYEATDPVDPAILNYDAAKAGLDRYGA